MVKKAGFVIIIFIILVFSVLNVYLFYNKGNVSYNTLSGKAIGDLPELPLGLNISLLAFIMQWLILIVIVVVAYVKFMKRKRHETLHISYSQIKKTKKRFETDFDVLYKLLQDKKKLTIGNIAKIFEVTEEQALDWVKIMEGNDLLSIEYPAFLEPNVRLKQKEDLEEEDEKKTYKPKEKVMVEKTRAEQRKFKKNNRKK